MIRFCDDKLTVNEYLNLRASVGWRSLTLRQAEKALRGSLYIMGVYDDDKLIGMGRIVGDGAVICYIQDLIVLPEYHGQGIGSKLIKELRRYVVSLIGEDEMMMFDLMCAKGREAFYEKNGFTARPTDTLGPGMIQYLTEDDSVIE